jgi:hypothetical protein
MKTLSYRPHSLVRVYLVTSKRAQTLHATFSAGPLKDGRRRDVAETKGHRLIRSGPWGDLDFDEFSNVSLTLGPSELHVSQLRRSLARKAGTSLLRRAKCWSARCHLRTQPSKEGLAMTLRTESRCQSSQTTSPARETSPKRPGRVSRFPSPLASRSNLRFGRHLRRCQTRLNLMNQAVKKRPKHPPTSHPSNRGCATGNPDKRRRPGTRPGTP